MFLSETITSGVDLPVGITSNADTVLYRAQAVGTSVSNGTPYWLTADELVAAIDTGNLPDRLGLPSGELCA